MSPLLKKQAIKYKNPKGNISLIMLFVLAISSLIWLITTNSVQEMINSTSSLRDFYQSYYISKWGLELWILAANRYEYGFEDTLTGTENILHNNLYCKKECLLELKINSRVKPTTQNILFWNTPEPITPAQCDSFTKNKIILSWGDSYIIPLFADNRTLQEDADIINLLDDQKYTLKLQSEQQESPLGLGISLWWKFKQQYNDQALKDKQTLYITDTIGQNEHIHNIDKFLYDSQSIEDPTKILPANNSIGITFRSSTELLKNDNFNYLFITNLAEKDFAFCLEAAPNTHGYTTDTTIITSIATYGNTTIGLEANKKKPLPSYIINSYSKDLE